MGRWRPRFSFANVMSVIAVFIALGGSAYAFHLGKNSVGSKQLKKNAITTAKIKKEAVTAAKVKKGTLTGKQINASSLGTVPNAQTAQTADTLASPEAWHEVGTPGEPQFENSWENFAAGAEVTSEPTAFYKDREGVVHLRGIVAGGTGNNTSIFRLPPGYRPGVNKLATFSVSCGCKEHTVAIFGALPSFPAESATVQLSGEGSLVSLNGITFRAEG